ncbi:MAG: hypothetical protein NTX71_09380 [Candidatus Aureabacteria bacterium]|nr:hypothetical protein [Candidatus Auribacterota bacterium]
MKKAALSSDVRAIIDSALGSYDTRIREFESLCDTTQQLLKGFEESFLDVHREREYANGELRELLAQNGSLRKRDFDGMMNGVVSAQEEREREVRDLLDGYFDEQREMARMLREQLDELRSSLGRGESRRVKEFQETIRRILEKTERRKNEVVGALYEFEKEQQELLASLRGLLAKGDKLQVKDLKMAVQEIQLRYQKETDQISDRSEYASVAQGTCSGDAFAASGLQ